MDVWWKQQVIGNCTVKRQGLYTVISCRCPPVSREICRLYAISQMQRVSLGVLVPEGGWLSLYRKVSLGHLPQGPYMLCIEDGRESFHPVWDGGTFPCVEKLSLGRWEKRGDFYGICISSATGQ